MIFLCIAIGIVVLVELVAIVVLFVLAGLLHQWGSQVQLLTQAAQQLRQFRHNYLESGHKLLGQLPRFLPLVKRMIPRPLYWLLHGLGWVRKDSSLGFLKTRLYF